MFLHLNSVHNQFMKRTTHVHKSVSDDIVLCELERVPFQLFLQKNDPKLLLLGLVIYLVTDWLQKRLSCISINTPW